MVLRLAAHVADLELLDAEHLRAGFARQPVRGAASESAESEHDVFVVALHRLVPFNRSPT